MFSTIIHLCIHECSSFYAETIGLKLRELQFWKIPRVSQIGFEVQFHQIELILGVVLATFQQVTPKLVTICLTRVSLRTVYVIFLLYNLY